MKYERTSNEPEWYESDPERLYHKAEMGTSASNEYYEFKNSAERLHCLKGFCSERFLDEMAFIGDDLFFLADIDASGLLQPDSIRNDWQSAFQLESAF